jgi:phage terminase large subunit
VISQADIESDRRDGMSEEKIQQEYYCSFEGYTEGTIYGDCIKKARGDGRIGRVPYDPNRPVGVCMDIGRSDPLSICFFQVHGSEIRWIDYYAARGSDTNQCVSFLHSKPYHYGRVILPHDARASDFNAPDSIEYKMRKAMRCPVDVNEKVTNRQVGIDLVRAKFPRFVFDEVACSRAPTPTLPSLLDSLGNYRYGWSEERQDNSGPPIHDQFSHGADAIRCGMEGWKEGMEFAGMVPNPVRAVTEFDVFSPVPQPQKSRRAKTDFEVFQR